MLHGGATVGHSEDSAADECASGDEETGQGLLRIGHDGELTFERLAGTPEQRFDRSDFDTLVVRDLLVGPSGPLAHGKNVAVTPREAVECTVDQFAVDNRQDELL